MHRPIDIKGVRAVYERHTPNHHQFFTDDEIRFRDHKDWRVTVFPPYALVVFILLSIPAALILGNLFTPNVGWLFMSVTTGMYLIYEFMHFCCHVDENWFVRNCPFVNTLRRHHTAHHNARLMMETNMKPDVPDRGLDVRHLRPRPRPRRHAAQRLRYALSEEEPARASAPPRRGGRGAHGVVLAVQDPRPWRREALRNLYHNKLRPSGTVPNDVKAIVSVFVLIVAAVLAYWNGSPMRPDFSTFIIITAVFMIVAMWVFPEAGVKKGDVKRAK